MLAETRVGDDGSETRVYPYANTFAHVIGYATNGKAGLEASCNYDLLDSHASVLTQLKESDNEKQMGDSVIVTLNASLRMQRIRRLAAIMVQWWHWNRRPEKFWRGIQAGL